MPTRIVGYEAGILETTLPAPDDQQVIAAVGVHVRGTPSRSMTFDPATDWRLDEARRRLGALVVSIHPAYKSLVVGHVHEAYPCGPGVYHVAVAWHDGSAVIPAPGGKPMRIDAVGYSRNEFREMLRPLRGSVYEALGLDAGVHPCRQSGLPCPVVTGRHSR